MLARGMTFHLGTDPAKDLTEVQVIDQCRMYIAAVRMADDFGCEAIGIQYQQGLKDLLPASDLVEGMLNNEDRPPVRRADGSIIRDGQAQKAYASRRCFSSLVEELCVEWLKQVTLSGRGFLFQMVLCIWTLGADRLCVCLSYVRTR